MKFKIAVGDWSDDGHGKCDYFMVETDCESIEGIRELYFRIKEKFDLDISEIAKYYGCNEMDVDDYNLLVDLGFCPKEDNFEIIDSDYIGILETEAIAEIIVFMLNKLDTGYKFNLVSESEVPMLQFWGFDDKKRHLSVGGYGLFE